MKNSMFYTILFVLSVVQICTSLSAMVHPNGFNFGTYIRNNQEQIASDEAFARALAQEEGMEGYIAQPAEIIIEPTAVVVAPVISSESSEEIVMPFTVYVAGKQDASYVSEIFKKSSFDGVARQLESIIDGKRLAEKAIDTELTRLTIIHSINERILAYAQSYSTTSRLYAIQLPKHSINISNLIENETELKAIQEFVAVSMPVELLQKLAPLALSFWVSHTTGKDTILYLEQDKINQLNEYAQTIEAIGMSLFSPMPQDERSKIITYQSKRIEKSQLPAAIKAHARNIIAVALQKIK